MRNPGSRIALLCAAILTAALTAVAPAADAAPRVAVYPGMAVHTGDEQCSVALTGHIGGTGYAVTAGHCFEAGARVYADTNALIGIFESGVPDGAADALGVALIRLTDEVSAVATTGRLSITAVDTDPVVGQRVCKTGARTGTTCGTIRDAAATHLLTTFAVDHGDSGGVVYTEVRSGAAVFVGMVVGMGNDFALVEPAAYLTDLIRRRGPAGADRFSWDITDSR
ncbi:hypothetical protein BJY24_001297 [Nocardia transvalensis]|uniref:Uncharacterized protein n=1 Tax=Nocardia transvalensis TaxID=37333 RepID=A0A7W9PAL1_9NOCA|nr:hypothetical protein [Nocardia transvalensis]MBB5912430.1 hypothetical protein [Nocardia transvalensis]